MDFQDNFHVFSKGSTKKLLNHHPELYDVQGNMIIYASYNQFLAFYNEKSILIDDLIPQEYKMGNDGVAYLDNSRVLKYFFKGKLYTVTTELVSKYYVNNNVVWYLVGVNTWKVFYNGENY